MKLFRSSGGPVLKADKEKWTKAMNEAMDKLEAEHGECVTQELALIFQETLNPLGAELEKLYPDTINIKYPETEAEMLKLTEETGTIAFTYEPDDNDVMELIAYIMDDA